MYDLVWNSIRLAVLCFCRDLNVFIPLFYLISVLPHIDNHMFLYFNLSDKIVTMV